jgi:arabinose-5-phosphate isomerase
MEQNNSIIQAAQAVIANEANAISQLSTTLNESFAQLINHLSTSKGRIVLTGVGKSAIIAQKIAATLNSTGSPALFMHAADAIHGDLGMVQQYDDIIIISKSGESEEIRVLTQLIKEFGNTIIALSGNAQSYLVANSHYFINCTIAQEACPNNLAPTTSTTAQLVMGDALAVCLLKQKGFTAADFARFHPGGALGKQLILKVSDVCQHNTKPIVSSTDAVQQVIITISSHRLGATAVVDAQGKLVGIITDGDLRRMMQQYENYLHLQAANIMSTTPKVISYDAMAIEALHMMQQHNISQLVVMQQQAFAGFVHIHDLLKQGLVA